MSPVWKSFPVLALLAMAAFAHADEDQTAPPSLAAPGKAGDIDVTLRDLAALGPDKLLRRLGELKQQVHDLKEDAKDRAEEIAALDKEAEATQIFIDGLRRLLDPPAPGSPDAPANPAPPVGSPWVRHDIEAGLSKSEGPRLGDINHDGLVDLATAWEGQQVMLVSIRLTP